MTVPGCLTRILIVIVVLAIAHPGLIIGVGVAFLFFDLPRIIIRLSGGDPDQTMHLGE